MKAALFRYSTTSVQCHPGYASCPKESASLEAQQIEGFLIKPQTDVQNLSIPAQISFQ